MRHDMINESFGSETRRQSSREIISRHNDRRGWGSPIVISNDSAKGKCEECGSNTGNRDLFLHESPRTPSANDKPKNYSKQSDTTCYITSDNYDGQVNN